MKIIQSGEKVKKLTFSGKSGKLTPAIFHLNKTGTNTKEGGVKVPIFVAFEGLSGAGKSTVAELVARKINAELVKTPPSPFTAARKFVDECPTLDPHARLFFYVGGLVQISQTITQMLENGHNVVCDRYAATTFCYHATIGDRSFVEHVRSVVSPMIQLPDLTLLITCEDVIRRHRLVRRGMNSNDCQEAKGDIEQRFMRLYRMEPNIIEVDNSTEDPCDAVHRILEIIRG